MRARWVEVASQLLRGPMDVGAQVDKTTAWQNACRRIVSLEDQLDALAEYAARLEHQLGLNEEAAK